MQNDADGQAAGASTENVSTIVETDKAKHLVALWNKEQSQRHFAWSLTMQLLWGKGARHDLRS